jgi:hypothetical protein
MRPVDSCRPRADVLIGGDPCGPCGPLGPVAPPRVPRGPGRPLDLLGGDAPAREHRVSGLHVVEVHEEGGVL